MFSSNTSQVSGGYQISRSLRFNSADTAYLSRTPASAGNRRTFTWSGWVKRSNLSAAQTLFSASNNSTTQFFISLLADNTLQALDWNGSVNLRAETLQVFRDSSAWYHVVFAVDTTQATSTNRWKLYVNGEQVTSFSGSSSYPSQNYDTAVNATVAHAVGREEYADTNYLSGYMTEVNFIDGQALTPSSFGETNAQTGVWQPKAYSGSYGTNGFYLNFSDNSNTTAATLGKDSSGNGNNWTPNNFSVSAGAGNDSLVDTPTPYGVDTGAGGTVRGNYATLNPLNVKLGAGSLTNGNLAFTGPSGSSAYNFVGGTFAVTTDTTIGFYFEVTQSTYGQFGAVSLLDIGFDASWLSTANLIGSSGANATSGISYRNDGNLYNYGTSTSSATTWTSNGDVIGVAIKDNKVWFSKNGTWISGDPAAGTSPSITLASTKTVTPAGTGINSCVFNYNFGQRPFAYTAPSGFKALCTQNLPTPTIGATSTTQADDYFNAVLYTGDRTDRTITVGFQPDWVWVKSRNQADNHYLMNAVVGTGKYLCSNLTDAEATNANTLTAFTSTGFSIGNTGTTNETGRTYVAWNWKANGAGSSNTAGSITSTVSANTTSGFSIVTWTGNSANATIGHGLGVAPSMVIIKYRGTTDNWYVYHTSTGAGQYLVLNGTGAAAASTNIWQNTAPTSSVFSIGFTNNQSTIVAYCFAEVPGFSKIGSYTGNGSSDGPFIFTGFRPAYVLIKASTTVPSGNSYWIIKDKLRTANYNPQNGNLYADASFAEDTASTVNIDLLSNGFKIRGTYDGINNSSATYIYMAFAENPFKYSLAR
jgi:hypothetical protein